MAPESVDFTTGAPAHGTLDVSWIHGSVSARRSPDPPLQAHAYDEHTVIIRQSKDVHYEAPFMYLMFGNDRALLLDTGATESPDAFPLRATVDQLVSGWLADHPRDAYQLVVAHTHAHGDHVAADGQFADRPSTTVLGKDVSSVRSFFGLEEWPGGRGVLDLGGRRLEVTGIPGHHEASIAIYDSWSGLLLTGDTVYPGRLYVQDMPAFVQSLERLVALAYDRPVTHVMGCHVEMTGRPRLDYPIGCVYQPDEASLQMSVDQLVAVRDAAREVAGSPGAHMFEDFTIFNGPCRAETARQLVRMLWGRMRNAATARTST